MQNSGFLRIPAIGWVITPIQREKRFRHSIWDFRTITRSKTLFEATDVTDTIWRAAKDVFDLWYKNSRGKMRLLGFGISQLSTAGTGQKNLFSQDDSKQKEIDKAVDQIKKRFGKGAIKREI